MAFGSHFQRFHLHPIASMCRCLPSNACAPCVITLIGSPWCQNSIPQPHRVSQPHLFLLLLQSDEQRDYTV